MVNIIEKKVYRQEIIRYKCGWIKKYEAGPWKVWMDCDMCLNSVSAKLWLIEEIDEENMLCWWLNVRKKSEYNLLVYFHYWTQFKYKTLCIFYITIYFINWLGRGPGFQFDNVLFVCSTQIDFNFFLSSNLLSQWKFTHTHTSNDEIPFYLFRS